jgi:hypothetical protein
MGHRSLERWEPRRNPSSILNPSPNAETPCLPSHPCPNPAPIPLPCLECGDPFWASTRTAAMAERLFRDQASASCPATFPVRPGRHRYLEHRCLPALRRGPHRLHHPRLQPPAAPHTEEQTQEPRRSCRASRQWRFSSPTSLARCFHRTRLWSEGVSVAWNCAGCRSRNRASRQALRGRIATAAVRGRSLFARFAVEDLAETAGAPLLRDHPWPADERRLMADVLPVPAGQVGDPVAMLILMETDDRLPHDSG